MHRAPFCVYRSDGGPCGAVNPEKGCQNLVRCLCDDLRGGGVDQVGVQHFEHTAALCGAHHHALTVASLRQRKCRAEPLGRAVVRRLRLEMQRIAPD